MTSTPEEQEALIYTGSQIQDATLPPRILTDDEGEFTVPGTRPETWRERAERLEEEVTRLRAWATLVSDLDRCEHGRHEGDVCSSCGGPSKGNPCAVNANGATNTYGGDEVLRLARRFGRMSAIPDRLLGFALDGRPIVGPARERRHDPDAWVQPR